MNMNIIPTTPPNNVNTTGRADFVKNNFDVLIWQKGYRVIHELALRCPCVSPDTNQQSNCANCGGTQWVFVNAKETKMVLSAMNMNTKYKEWSQENIGTASISALAEDECSFMDRITVLDANAIFGEVLFLKTFDTTYYWKTIYNIKEIDFLALFVGVDQKLKPLKYGEDFTFSDNRILFAPTSIYYHLIDPSLDKQDISITIRYKHAPQFHVVDIPRETMQTNINIGSHGSEEAVNLPIHAIGRRSHYILDEQNFNNTRVLRNDHNFEYTDLNPPKNIC